MSLVALTQDRAPSQHVLNINEDIKAYYKLVDTVEMLEALIIKHCKSPLLQSIVLDMHQGKTLNNFEQSHPILGERVGNKSFTSGLTKDEGLNEKIWDIY